MFPNLRAEMARRNITGNEMAEVLGITSGTFSAKYNGKADFTLPEAMMVKAELKTELPLEVLFEPDEA